MSPLTLCLLVQYKISFKQINLLSNTGMRIAAIKEINASDVLDKTIKAGIKHSEEFCTVHKSWPIQGRPSH